MKNIKIVLFLLIILIIILSSCKKSKEDGRFIECFEVGEVGNKLTYQRLLVDNVYNDTLSIDTIVNELLNINNNIYKFNNFPASTNIYKGAIFGIVKSFSPLIIDTLVNCNSITGDSHGSVNIGFSSYPTSYTVQSTNASYQFKSTSLKCYKISFYDGETWMNYYINKKYGIVKQDGGNPLFSHPTYSLIDANF